MIKISGNNLNIVIKKAYNAINLAPLSNDPDIYKEDTAMIMFENGYEDPGFIKAESELKCIFNQQELFPENNSLKNYDEDKYWNEKLQKTNLLNNMISNIIVYPNNRSCLYSFWNNEDFKFANTKAECITQIYLRKRGDFLEMHTHVRANDVHRCLFMDLAYLLFAHKYICDKSNFKKGEFVHFIDSMHVYNKSSEEFQKQLNYINAPNSNWANV